MTDIENQANQNQKNIRPTGAPTNTQNIDTEQGKKANKCCLPKPAIIAIVVVAVLLAILIPVILFTVVLKDDESAEEKCVERNTKEVDMMRRFDQIKRRLIYLTTGCGKISDGYVTAYKAFVLCMSVNSSVISFLAFCLEGSCIVIINPRSNRLEPIGSVPNQY